MKILMLYYIYNKHNKRAVWVLLLFAEQRAKNSLEVAEMAVKRDYYEILGLKRDADASAIKRAYRKLAKKYHPDTNAGDVEAERKFKEITEAYSVLNDPEKRKLYDRFGHAAFEEGFSAERAGQSKNGERRYTEFHFEDGGDDDLWDSLFGQMFHDGRGFHGSFHSSFRGDSRDYFGAGQDVETEVSVSFEEAAFGCEKVIRLPKPDGSIQSLQVHIPAGIDDGNSVRLRGQGASGRGGAAGDLYLMVRVGKKQGYERKGLDVYTTAEVPYTTAALGGKARIHTLYGDVECSIREGTQSGSKIRLRGKGIVSMKNPGKHGDQYVTVQIQVPKSLSPAAREKLKEYGQLCS